MRIIYTTISFLSLLFLVFLTGQNVFSQEKGTAASVLSRSILESDEVLSQWHSLAAVVENFNGTLVRQAMYGADKIELIDRTDFKRKGNNTKSELWRLESESQTLMRHGSYCSNPHYSFTLRHKQETGTDNPWNVLNIQKQTFSPELDSVLSNELNSGPLGYMRAPYSIAGIPFWNLTKDKDFAISNVRYADADSKMVSIEFLWKVPDYMFPVKSVDISKSVKGYVEFNTQKYWRIEKLFFCVSYKDGGKQVFRYLDNYLDYAESEKGVPYVVKCTEYTSAVKHGEKKLPATIHEITDVNFVPVADSEFFLSHYGLPEPDFDEERPIGWFRYTLMAAGGLLIVFALWRMYRERKGTNV